MFLPAVVPWEVAEVVALRLAKLSPRTIWIVGPDHGRIRRVTSEGLEPTPRVEASPTPPEASERRRSFDRSDPASRGPQGDHEALVWITDGTASSPWVRAQLLEVSRRCIGDVVMVEPVAPGCGVGLDLARRIDPAYSRLECDEVTSKRGTTRRRKPWEAPGRWLVAQAAAWRFAPDAEAARAGYRTRLPRMDAAQIVMACRRLHQRYGRAFEIFALAAEELARRGDRRGVHQVQAELVMSGGGPLGVRSRVRHAAVSTWVEADDTRRAG